MFSFVNSIFTLSRTMAMTRHQHDLKNRGVTLKIVVGVWPGSRTLIFVAINLLNVKRNGKNYTNFSTRRQNSPI